jgi:hypothetical protein
MSPQEEGGRHLVHSHAKEGDVPGTVDLNAKGELRPFLNAQQPANRQPEGDDTGYGQALYPVPADDPNDPLQVWTRSRTAVP